MLDRAAQEILSYPAVRASAERPLTQSEYVQLGPTLEHAYLRHELRRCLPALAHMALRPSARWLQALGTASVTLVPCGALAAFPLLAVPLNAADDAADWQTLGDLLPASLAPSGRALERGQESPRARTGVATLGDPWPTHQELAWGEAEALTLAALGGDPYHAAIHTNATRAWLLEALGQARVVDASCHGEFDPLDFLQSRLLLANGETLTLGDMLGGATDLRGLRLLILSACQTAILDLRGARDEVRSLAAGMLGAGAEAVLGALWSVDDKATYLLMVRFAQEWFPTMDREAPGGALARAQRWLRGATNRELRQWEAERTPPASAPPAERAEAGELIAVRGRGNRYGVGEAAERITAVAELAVADARPYRDPIYWSAFQIAGW